MIRSKGTLLASGLILVLSLASAAQVAPNVVSSKKQTTSLGDSHDERISKVENGLIDTPVIIPGERFVKSSLPVEMNSNQVPGLSVAIIDKFHIAWAKGYGVTDVRSKTPVSADTLFCAGGITKFVTAVAVLRLVQDKKLDLDRDVNTLLVHWKIPTNEFTSKHSVTIRELLSHSAGVSRHRPSTAPPSGRIPDIQTLINRDHDSSDEQLDVVFQPGSQFDYSSGGFVVLQQLLTDVENKPFPEIIQHLVFDPAGMRQSTFVQPTDSKPNPYRASGHHSRSPDGKGPEADVLAFPELAGSGMWTTASDLATLVINLQKSGEPRSLLSRASYEVLVHPVLSNAALGAFVVGDNEGRRFRVRSSDGTPGDTFAGWLVGYVNGGKGAVILANSPDAFPVGFGLLRSIAVEYNWTDYIQVRPSVKVDTNVYKQYVGRYQLGGTIATVSASADGQTLLGQMGNSERVPLYPYSPTTFFVSTELLSEGRIRFLFDKDGKVTGLVLEYLDRGESYTAPRIP